jgi:CRP/FNR family nitrogen fixation transcriptional regulator
MTRMLSQTTFPIAATSSAIQDPDVKALLAQSQPGAVTFYPTDAMIYAEGDAAGPLYLVEFGTIRICRMTSDGRRQITSFCYAGDVFGLEDGDEHQSYAESVDGAGLRTLRPAHTSNFAQRLLGLALRRFARVQKHLLLLGRMSANERMAQFLLDLLDRQGSEDVVNLPMQRNDIADYLGMTFETVSRVLRVLKDRRVIRLNSVEQIEVLNFDDLAALAA